MEGHGRHIRSTSESIGMHINMAVPGVGAFDHNATQHDFYEYAALNEEFDYESSARGSAFHPSFFFTENTRAVTSEARRRRMRGYLTPF